MKSQSLIREKKYSKFCAKNRRMFTDIILVTLFIGNWFNEDVKSYLNAVDAFRQSYIERTLETFYMMRSARMDPATVYLDEISS